MMKRRCARVLQHFLNEQHLNYHAKDVLVKKKAKL